MLDAFDLIFGIIAFFLFFEYFICKKMRNMAYWFSVFLIIIIYSMRDYSIGAGGDTEVYVEAYREIGSLDFEQMMQFGWEPGYVILNKLIYVLFQGNERCFVALIEVLIMLPIAKYIKQTAPLPNFCLLLFVAFGGIIHTGLFRQMLAFAIILYSLKYLKNTNNKYIDLIKFFSIIFFASLFHITALLFSFVYFVKLNVSLRALLISFIISLLVCSFGPVIYDVLIQLSRIDYAMVTDGGMNKSIFLYIVAAIGVVFCKKVINNNYEIDGRLFMLTVALQPFCLIFGLASRVLIYFELSMMVVISVMLNIFLNRIAVVRGVMFVNLLIICIAYGIFINSKYQQYIIF